MDRSRSKRYYYDQDYESETLYSRTKPRYGNNFHGGGGNHYGPSNHRRSAAGGGGGRKMQDTTTVMVTTSYRILCHDVKAGGVIGKSGSIIKAIRQHTGAWINVHEVIPGDEERIIEISDTRRRDPDGRMPNFSPAQEALILVHDRILETEVEQNVRFGDDDLNDEYGNRGGGGGGGRVVTRLVVSRMHVGSLLGKGGKIIEQMRMETKTHIRVLPRDHTLPRCVSMSEEIVQVVGDMNAVKNAITVISSRLRESQHRDRSNSQNRLNPTDNFFPGDDDFPVNTTPRRSSEGPSYGSKHSPGPKSDNNPSRSFGPASTVSDNAQSFTGMDLVFRILCPVDKVDSVVGESDGIVELLQNEIGVNVDVSDPVGISDERIIIISSDEGPNDLLFPAQEALLHIQTRIVDLVPEKENIVTTRLLLQSDDVGSLIEQSKIGSANIEILPREQLPAGISGTDEIIQIVGEIKAAREALVEVTSRVRSYIYREFLEKDARGSHVSTLNRVDVDVRPEAASKNNLETRTGNGPVVSLPQSSSSLSTVAASQKVKDAGPRNVEPVKQNELEEQPSGLSRISVPLVTRSILEVVIPPHAYKLVTNPRKLNLISELSGANVKLIEDGSEKTIQISGTPEQAERAQGVLQGFILSTEEDGS